jgi:hypothetical protein
VPADGTDGTGGFNDDDGMYDDNTGADADDAVESGYMDGVS